jgi:hypothetical protein
MAAQLVVSGANEAGIDAQNEVGTVVPLGRVRGSTAGIVCVGEEKTLHLTRRHAGHEVNRFQAGAECSQLLRLLHRVQMPVASGRHVSLPSAEFPLVRTDE